MAHDFRLIILQCQWRCSRHRLKLHRMHRRVRRLNHNLAAEGSAKHWENQLQKTHGYQLKCYQLKWTLTDSFSQSQSLPNPIATQDQEKSSNFASKQAYPYLQLSSDSLLRTTSLAPLDPSQQPRLQDPYMPRLPYLTKQANKPKGRQVEAPSAPSSFWMLGADAGSGFRHGAGWFACIRMPACDPSLVRSCRGFSK